MKLIIAFVAFILSLCSCQHSKRNHQPTASTPFITDREAWSILP